MIELDTFFIEWIKMIYTDSNLKNTKIYTVLCLTFHAVEVREKIRVD